MSDAEHGLLFDMAERLFAERCGIDTLASAEAGDPAKDLWEQLAETGLLSMLEAGGGIEAAASALAGVLRLAGRCGLPGAFAETVVARWLTSEAGLEAPSGPLLMALDGWRLRDGGLSGRVRQPGEAVLVVLETQAGLIALGDFETGARRNLAGEAQLDLRVDPQAVSDRLAPISARDAQRAADLLRLARAALICGALEKTLELSVTYAEQRVQFGRPISKFQAIQQQLAVLASEVAAASAITSAAAQALDMGRNAMLLDAAQVRLADAADQACAISHQVHGAIGVTREYPLHYFTRRLMAWRDEAGSLAQARLRLADAFQVDTADALWPAIVDRAADRS